MNRGGIYGIDLESGDLEAWRGPETLRYYSDVMIAGVTRFFPDLQIQLARASYRKINELSHRFPDSIFVFETHGLRGISSDEVGDNIMPYTKAVIVIDRAENHQRTGIEHFSLNLESEGKALIWTDDDAFVRSIRNGSRTEKVDPGLFGSADITVFHLDRPLTVAADDHAKWGMIYRDF